MEVKDEGVFLFTMKAKKTVAEGEDEEDNDDHDEAAEEEEEVAEEENADQVV